MVLPYEGRHVCINNQPFCSHLNLLAMKMNAPFLASHLFLRTPNLLCQMYRRLARGIPTLFVIFTGQMLFAQTEVCDTMTNYGSPPPAEIDCSHFDITIHVGSASGGAALASASTAFPSTSVASGLNIMVSGTFTIDKDFTFLDCKVFFNENAEMPTFGAVTLVGIRTVFTNCENRPWKSIQIKAGAAIRFDGCSVAGALDGLDFRKDYSAKYSMLYSNQFYRNRYSIISLENGTLLAFSEFAFNEFYGSQAVPGTGTLPHSGIRLVGCNAFIGTPVIYEEPQLFLNTFDGLRFGIEAFGGSTSLYVTNCRFVRMRPDIVNGTMTGCGINAIGATVTVSAIPYMLDNVPLILGQCFFDDCASAGIRAVQCKLDVQYAVFNGKHVYGISSKSPGFRTQRIQDCSFNVGGHPICKGGIFLERPNGSGNTYSTRINRNVFDLYGEQNTAAGIDVRCPVSSMDLMEIRENNITITGNSYFRSGIIVYGGQSDNIQIAGNTLVHTNGSTNSFNVFLVNLEGRGHVVEENSSTGGAQCNYHLEKSRNVFYCENISDGAGNGFHFYGDNDNAAWSKSDIDAHGSGLLINSIPDQQNPNNPPLSSGRISEQVRKGNLWESDGNKYGDKAARCDANASFSRFLVENSTPAIKPTKIFPTTDWFFEVSGETEYCTGVSRPISTFEDLLASGEELSVSEAEEWEATRLLLETLLHDPGLLTGDTVLQAFYTQNLNTTAGQFAQINQMIREGSYSTSVLWGARATKESQFEAARIILDSLMTRSELSDLESNLYYPGDTMAPIVQGQMIVLDDSIRIIEASLSSTHDVVLNQALDAIDTMTLTENYETAYKILRVYQIKTALGYEPEDAGYEDLMDVAAADEADYGGAVRQARHYLSDCERYAGIAPNEEEDEERPLSASIAVSIPNISIVPNPSSSSIQVSLDRENLGTGIWEIISSFGTVTKSGSWPTGQTRQQFMLDGVASGAYYFVLRTDGGATSAQKLIVIR